MGDFNKGKTTLHIQNAIKNLDTDRYNWVSRDIDYRIFRCARFCHLSSDIASFCLNSAIKSKTKTKTKTKKKTETETERETETGTETERKSSNFPTSNFFIDI